MNNQAEVTHILSYLNTWEIPNKERIPRDHLLTHQDVTDYAYDTIGMKRNTDDFKDVIQLRDELREMIDSKNVDSLNKWVQKREIHFHVTTKDTKPYYDLSFCSNEDSLVNNMIIYMLVVIRNGVFHRIKICPDCKWAFYDESKSGTKKWCSMNANSETGRACGTISKVRRYREKRKTE
ncbi:CGNR zinc finger domain-containing protein [Bacillus solimangrovi]|uniref:Zinc finger CGNR domain-containing protein n=1 Tax=Bacillus solimangrovi TaxID=1305675 RepID=A0A1E5LIG9_9BACI|nr:CGNR zinc finger domain-containing protein [Bacillus solimangrovi]OEH93861.1 hypothetical protein BFG57_11110 [Bacillus solimangrovi]